MNVVLTLSFLGSFHVTLVNQPKLHFPTDKVRALLAYLAVEAERPHERTRLAHLLWPDMAERAALRNLTQTLTRLRQAVPSPSNATPLLLVTPRDIQFNPQAAYRLDVTEFIRLASSPSLTHLEQAAELYHGDFLSGFSIPDSDVFEEWALLKREALHRQALDLFYRLAAHYEQQAEYETVRRYARRQLELEPWREEAHQQLIRALALSGQRSAALAQFTICRQLLADELGVEPAAPTVALYEQVRDGALGLKPPRLTLEPARWERADDEIGPRPPRLGSSAWFHDWSEAPDSTAFFGRRAELAQLEHWLVADRCRLVAILGLGGMGKTALTAITARSLAEHFDRVVWRSLINAPPLSDLIRGLLQPLSDPQTMALPDRLEDRLALLFDYVRRYRCLLVLDNLESILQSGRAGAYRPGYEDYSQLVQRFAHSEHQSCLLLTSRERPQGLERLAGDSVRVRSLQLEGLDGEAGREILIRRGFAGSRVEEEALIRSYSGNPLALKLVAETVHDLFGGDVAAFLAQTPPIFDDIRDVLEQQFSRLSPLEHDIIRWLAIEREAVSPPTLANSLVQPGSQRALLEAMRGLERRSLLEKHGAAFTLQNVVMDYTTEQLVEQVCSEIQHGVVGVLNSHALLKAQAKEYVRQSQLRLILGPIATRLVARRGRAALIQQAWRLLDNWRDQSSPPVGYLAGNILNLLLHLEVDLRGADFSHLSVWQAYMKGKSLPDINFAGADLTGSVFTDTFSTTRSIALSREGQWLAAGTDDHEVRLWHTDGQSHSRYIGHQGPVLAVAFSPEGRTLASGSADQTVRLWEVQSGQVRQTLSGHRAAVKSVAFSPDGHDLASGSQDHTVRVWDLATGQCRHILSGHTGWVWSVAYSPDGQTLASSSFDHTICLWDTSTGQRRLVLEGHTAPAGSLAFHPSGDTLCCGGADRSVRLWDTHTGHERGRLEGHSNWVLAVAYSPTGEWLASADDGIHLWDTRTGQRLKTMHGHSSLVHSLVFSADGKTLTSGSFDETIRVWDIQSGQCLQILHGYTRPVRCIAFTPDGQRLMGGSQQMLRVWDIHSRQAADALGGWTHDVVSFSLRSNDRLLATCGGDKAIYLWDVHAGRLVHTLHGHTEAVTSVAFHPCGEELASSSEDRTVRLWDIRTGQCSRVLGGHTHWVAHLAFSPDGQRLASASFDRTIRLWETHTGDLLHTLHGGSAFMYCVSFSPDGRLVAAGDFDHQVHLWDAETGHWLKTLSGHGERVFAIAFDPQSRYLASSGADRTIRLWDVTTGECRSVLQGHTGWVWSVAFSPDGRYLASGSHDETIRLWDVSSGACLDTWRTEGPYAGMNISGARGLTEAQTLALRALGAVDDVR